MTAPFLTEHDSDACWVCPSLRLPAGWFDVYERPTQECPFDPQSGFRYAGGTPVCVHPYKVGLPAGRYASEGIPLPDLPVRPPAPPPRPLPEPPVLRLGPAEPPEEDPADDAAIMAGERPDVPDELVARMRAVVASADPDDLEAALSEAELTARQNHPPDTVVEALRRALGGR